jgi:putative copper export protein
VNDSLGLVDAMYAAARWGWYLSAFLLLGASSYAPFFFSLHTGLRRSHDALAREITRRAARVGLAAAACLLVLTAVRLYLQSKTLLDPGEPVTAEFLKAVLGSNWGRGWKRQAIAGLLALTAFLLAQRGARSAWLLAVITSLAVGATAGMTGHANTARSGSGGILLDATHVTAGGLWLGGVGVMLLAGVTACGRLAAADRSDALRALVAGFSRRALVLAPLTIALGVWLAARYLGWSFPLHLTASSYGWVLAGKLTALAGTGAMGAYNWRITQPRLHETTGERRLRRVSALELLFGVVLLGLTAILVALPLPEGRM